MPVWDWRVPIVALTVGGIVGARLGVRVAGRLHDATLERLIAGLLIGIAVLLGTEAAAGDTLIGPLATGDWAGVTLGLRWDLR